MATTKWGLIWSKSKGERKYFSYKVWENIAGGIAINLFDKFGLLGFLAKPRSLSEIESKINNNAVFSKLVKPILNLLVEYGYINKLGSDTYQVNSSAINELMRTLKTYPHTAFRPLIKAAEKFMDKLLIEEFLEKGEINAYDPRLITIFREVFTSDFISNQIESIIVWSGGHINFYNKEILLLFSNIGYNAKFLIEKIGYKNLRKIIIVERSESVIELAKRVSVSISGEDKLLGDLDKVEFINIGKEADLLSESVSAGSIDIVLNLIQLYTVKNLEKLFTDIHKILKKNGIFIAGIPIKERSDKITLLDIITKFYNWHHIYSEKELKDLLSKVGFRKIKIDYSFYLRGVK